MKLPEREIVQRTGTHSTGAGAHTIQDRSWPIPRRSTRTPTGWKVASKTPEPNKTDDEHNQKTTDTRTTSIPNAETWGFETEASAAAHPVVGEGLVGVDEIMLGLPIESMQDAAIELLPLVLTTKAIESLGARSAQSKRRRLGQQGHKKKALSMEAHRSVSRARRRQTTAARAEAPGVIRERHSTRQNAGHSH